MSGYPRLRSHLTDPSGGLGYHWRAWRRRVAWQPFHAWLGTRLNGWRPDRDTLVLVGPSAGYALDMTFLSRWRAITVFEPDMLARILLRRRFAQLPIRFAWLDALAMPDGPRALVNVLTMNNKMRSALRIIAVLLVLLAVLMQLEIVIIPALLGIKFWLVVIAFGLIVVSSK